MPKKTSPKKARAAKKKSKAGPAKAPAKKAASKRNIASLGLSKQFMKSRPVVRVTFRLPREAAQEASAVSVVGDFNGWEAGASPMKRLRDGSFSATVELEIGREYRFRYLIDGGRWENDWLADRYEPNAFGGEDSVVVCF